MYSIRICTVFVFVFVFVCICIYICCSFLLLLVSISHFNVKLSFSFFLLFVFHYNYHHHLHSCLHSCPYPIYVPSSMLSLVLFSSSILLSIYSFICCCSLEDGLVLVNLHCHRPTNQRNLPLLLLPPHPKYHHHHHVDVVFFFCLYIL